MDTHSPSSETHMNETLTNLFQQPINRRKALAVGTASALGIAASTLGVLEALARTPIRQAHAAPPRLPDIQFDINDYIGPAKTVEGILVRFGPVYTLFLTAQFTRTPTKQDQQALSHALDTIEATYPFSPTGVFTFVSYGLPYFRRLPPKLVEAYIPRLLTDHTRLALEEAVPSPTDMSAQNPGITKQTYNIPVAIESNDILFTLRSDSLVHLQAVSAWLQGNSSALNGQKAASADYHSLFKFTSSRLEFAQMGLPRHIANANNLPYAGRVNPHSPMWMGFADQQVNSSGPAAITTFQGNASGRFTETKSEDYFFNGSIQHLSHVILDLNQFYASTEPFTERCQYMFRSNPIPSTGNAEQFTNGGGPAFLNNVYQGVDDALNNARAVGTFKHAHRMGHLTALQRSSRAPDGTPIHIRMDGPGFDNMDVPDGSGQPKLQFTIFVPTAHFFTEMRRNQAALDLVQAHQVRSDDNGLERFITATRRQNFLVPPRAHRAFPLLELTN